MTIGITRKTSSQVTGLGKNKATGKAGQADSSSAAKAGKQQDSVQLTASATQLQELENRIASMPVVDAGLVDAVQQDLAAGNYEVNEKRTANKLIDTEKKLAGSD